MKPLAEFFWRPDRWRGVLVAMGVGLVAVAGCSSDSATSDSATSNPASNSALVSATPGSNAAVTDTAGQLGAATTNASTEPIPAWTVAPTGARIIGTITVADLVSELSAAETTAATGLGEDGRRQQLFYRYLSAHAELDEAVLAGIDDAIRPYAERIIRARQFSQARQAENQNPSPPSDTLPAWEVVDPLPSEELLSDYQAAETATGINWFWLAAIHLQETRMGRIIGTSSAGAVGPMQFLPNTWARCCVGDPTIARDAIMGAATYLAQNGGPDDMRAALHVYNPSDTYVQTVTAFAENMRDNPKLYAAYRQWQVFYSTSAGTVRLPVGYREAQPIDAATYLVSHPEDAA